MSLKGNMYPRPHSSPKDEFAQASAKTASTENFRYFCPSVFVSALPEGNSSKQVQKVSVFFDALQTQSKKHRFFSVRMNPANPENLLWNLLGLEFCPSAKQWKQKPSVFFGQSRDRETSHAISQQLSQQIPQQISQTMSQVLFVMRGGACNSSPALTAPAN